MPKETKFEISGKDLIIMRDDWRARTTYDESKCREIMRREWRKDNNGYIVNSSVGLLHRYVMKMWYGEDVLTHMAEQGYVVDHMNNDHVDCRISNLEFLKKSYNTAKGQAFDVDSREMKWNIAINIFKDFSTGCYQITIGCNDLIYFFNSENEKAYINNIKLLYNCDYSIVVNDAENILREYDTEKTISLRCLRACKVRVEIAPIIELSEVEKAGCFVWRDGKPYLVLGTGKCYLGSVHYEEGWLPPEQE